MKKMSFLLIPFLIILCSSCEMKLEEVNRESVLGYISIDISKAEKLTYLIGDSFNSNGIVIYGHYSDTSVKEENPRLIEYSGFSSKKANEDLTITATLGQLSDTFKIKILDATVTSIDIIRKPKKLYYFVGESLDLDGMLIVSNYTDGTKRYISNNECEISGFDSSLVTPQQIITVSYKKDFKATFSISVQLFDVKEIFIQKKPKHLHYTKGDSLNLEGLEVIAKNTNGVMFRLDSFLYQVGIISGGIDITQTNGITDISELDAGDYDIKISVNDCSAVFAIQILNTYQVGIAMKKDSGNRLYYKGEIFKLENFVFYEKLSNGELGKNIEYKNLTSDMEGKPLNKIGINTIIVNYTFLNKLTQTNENVSYSFDICVTESQPKRIQAQWKLHNKGYPLGISPTPNDKYGKWEVKCILIDGTSVDIPAEYCTFEFEDQDMKNGNYLPAKQEIEASKDKIKPFTVTVSYFSFRGTAGTQYTCKANVMVSSPVITSMNITKVPKTEYICGEPFSLAGIEATLYFSDSSYTIYSYSTHANCFSVDTPVLNTVGEQLVKITVKREFATETYKCDLNVYVRENRILGLRIGKKNTGDIYFRLGKKYENKDFLDIFNISKRYEYNTGESANVSDNLIFSMEKGKEFKSGVYKGSVYAIYKESGKTFSGQYSNTLEGANQVYLLSPLPNSILMTKSEDIDKKNFSDNLKTEKIRFNIKFEDGSVSEISGKNFTDDTYSYNGITYTLDIEKKFVAIKYKANEKALNESNEVINSISYVLDYSLSDIKDLIKSLEIKNNKELKFKEIVLAELPSYFLGNATYFTGYKETLDSKEFKYEINGYNKTITVSYMGVEYGQKFSYQLENEG